MLRTVLPIWTRTIRRRDSGATFGARGQVPGTTAEDRYMEPPVYQAAADYLDRWYASSMWRMRPLLSSFAHDGTLSPGLYDELANELLDCPPDHDRARDLIALARLMVEHLKPR
jgi:hypothetical protein